MSIHDRIASEVQGEFPRVSWYTFYWWDDDIFVHVRHGVDGSVCVFTGEDEIESSDCRYGRMLLALGTHRVTGTATNWNDIFRKRLVTERMAPL